MIKICDNEKELIEVAKLHVDNQKISYVGMVDQDELDKLNYKDNIDKWRKWQKREIES